MMRTLFLAAALAGLVVLVAPGTDADHSLQGGFCKDTLYVPAGADEGETAPVYVALHAWGWSGPFSLWVYAESNGAPGLQRHDDACSTGGWENADTIVF